MGYTIYFDKFCNINKIAIYKNLKVIYMGNIKNFQISIIFISKNIIFISLLLIIKIKS